MLHGLSAGKKTILGDAHQSVNPYSSSTAESIRKVFPNADFVNLRKSYRSTLEIARFAQRIAGSDDLEVVERHGETPVVKGFTHEDEEMEAIFNFIDVFQKSGHQSLGVICKTQKQAERLHDRLKEKVPQIYLLDAQSASLSKGVILTTAHMAKGLEFDCVTAPFASAENYHTEMDKRLLYIACTRAMHILHITYCGQRTQFIKLTN